MKSLKNYALCVMANHNVMDFTAELLSSIRDNSIEYKHIYFGDVGFTEDDKKALKGYGLDITFIDLEYKFTSTGSKTQSPEYRKIIAQRPQFLQTVASMGNNSLVSLDADTAVISNDFTLLNTSKDITLTVREAGPDIHVLPIFEVDYPNCGVIFYHNMKNCEKFFERWEWCMKNVEEHELTFEQWYFYSAMQFEEFQELDVQKLHCRYYNCYDINWKNKATSILHYKSYDAKRDTFETRVARLK